MNTTDKLTPKMLEISDILISSNLDGKDSQYYKDLRYGIKRVLGLDVLPDRERDKRIALRLTPEVRITERERTETYSRFAHEFYRFYKLSKANIGDKSKNKSTKELRKVFIQKPNNENARTCFITIK